MWWAHSKVVNERHAAKPGTERRSERLHRTETDVRMALRAAPRDGPSSVSRRSCRLHSHSVVGTRLWGIRLLRFVLDKDARVTPVSRK